MWKCLCSAERVLMVNTSEHSGSGSSWAVTCCGCCLRKAEGEIAFTRGKDWIFWELGWAAFVCGFFSPETPQLILLVSLSLLSSNSTLWFFALSGLAWCFLMLNVGFQFAPSFFTEHGVDARPVGLGGLSLYETETESEVVLGWCTYVPKITSGL